MNAKILILPRRQTGKLTQGHTVTGGVMDKNKVVAIEFIFLDNTKASAILSPEAALQLATDIKEVIELQGQIKPENN